MPSEPIYIPSDSPEAQALNALHAIVREVRGTTIDQAIWLDLVVTDILATSFCGNRDRRRLLSSDVLTGRDASFSGRLDVLEKVAKAWYPEFVALHPQLFCQLSKIRRFRNRLTHSHVDTSVAFMAQGHTDRIQLLSSENGKEKTQTITAAEFRERLAEGTQIMLALVELQDLVAPATKNNDEAGKGY